MWTRKIASCFPVAVAMSAVVAACSAGTTAGPPAVEADVSDVAADQVGLSGLDQGRDGIPDVPDGPGAHDADAFPDWRLPDWTSEVGKPCVDTTDCLSGLCIDTGAGSVCTTSCVEDCPAGWACKGTSLFGSDIQFICVPTYWKICQACTTDEDCKTDQGICVGVADDGKRCAVPCPDSADCPAGYVCEDLASQPLCLPSSGSCLCQDGDEGQTRDCKVKNEFGECPGQQECLGASGWEACTGQIPAQEACDGLDNDCDEAIDEGFPDLDLDLLLDCLDDDDDGDEVPDLDDNCPLVHNPLQENLDGDPQGDVCDNDDDNDTVPDSEDNCPGESNPDQADVDLDKLGDACDSDDDNDGLPDGVDNCPLASNPLQQDNDVDGLGDACDVDDDNDGVPDLEDNCPLVANSMQDDCDSDKQGDACDNDDDNDGVVDTLDCGPCDPSIFPGVAEACNGLDDNCNGSIDEAEAVTSCMPYSCTGPAGCADHCEAAIPCAEGFYCDIGDGDNDGVSDECIEALPDGSPCKSLLECTSGYCNNGFCCNVPGELCCAQDEHCKVLEVAPVCDAPSQCSGHKMVGSCTPSHSCKAQQVPEPTACSGQVCVPDKYCSGSAIRQSRYCGADGVCSQDGPVVQGCQGSNPCCTYGCSNAACWSAFNGDLGCLFACFSSPVICVCW